MRAKIRRCFSILMAVAILSGGILEMVFAEGQEKEQQHYGIQAENSRMAEENGVTVTSSDEFMDALASHKSPITVMGVIAIDNGVDTDNRMLPVKFPAGTVVQATAESVLFVRSPIQLEGDGVCFKDIDLV